MLEQIQTWAPPQFVFEVDGEKVSGYFYRGKDFVDVHLPSGTFRFRYSKTSSRRAQSHEMGDLMAPMPGKILKLLAKPGQVVKKGEVLLVLEAMKMEHQILSPLDGEVIKVDFQEGDRVKEGEELLEVRAKSN